MKSLDIKRLLTTLAVVVFVGSSAFDWPTQANQVNNWIKWRGVANEHQKLANALTALSVYLPNPGGEVITDWRFVVADRTEDANYAAIDATLEVLRNLDHPAFLVDILEQLVNMDVDDINDQHFHWPLLLYVRAIALSFRTFYSPPAIEGDLRHLQQWLSIQAVATIIEQMDKNADLKRFKYRLTRMQNGTMQFGYATLYEGSGYKTEFDRNLPEFLHGMVDQGFEAAHKYAPYGTLARVHVINSNRTANDLSQTVVINDDGPNALDRVGRIIDLNVKVMKKFSNWEDGWIPVWVDFLELHPQPGKEVLVSNDESNGRLLVDGAEVTLAKELPLNLPDLSPPSVLPRGYYNYYISLDNTEENRAALEEMIKVIVEQFAHLEISHKPFYVVPISQNGWPKLQIWNGPYQDRGATTGRDVAVSDRQLVIDNVSVPYNDISGAKTLFHRQRL